MAESLLMRFSGDSGNARLKIALQDQVILSGNTLACDEIAQRCKLREVAGNEILIRQDGVDNDIYFVLAGAFAVIVNGRRVALRRAGQHLGEMAIVDPSARRSATVLASEPSIVAQLSEADFLALADKFPTVWRLLSRELSRRLDERRKFHAERWMKGNERFFQKKFAGCPWRIAELGQNQAFFGFDSMPGCAMSSSFR